MRILYLFCHPIRESFHGAILDQALAGLAHAGHTVDLQDLYAEGFDPVLDADARRRYHDLARNQQGLEETVHRLQEAEALIVQFPTWCFGPPAMLKGYLDRVMMPGVAFDLSDPGHARPLLSHIRKVAGIVTYGRPRWAAWAMGNPPKTLITRYLRWFAAPKAKISFHALYHMNVASYGQRQRFLDRVGSAMTAF